MSTSASSSEVRIDYPVGDQIRAANAFIGLYAMLAVAGLVASFLRPNLLPGAVFFTVFLVWWAVRIRRPTGGWQPWAIVLTPGELRHTTAGVDLRIARSQAVRVRIARRTGPRMGLLVLEVTGDDSARLLQVSLPGPHAATRLRAGLAEWGWPVT